MTGQTTLLVAERSRPLYADGGGARRWAGPGEQVSGPAVDSYTHTHKKKSSEELQKKLRSRVEVAVPGRLNRFCLFCCRLRCFSETVCFGSKRTSSGRVSSRPASVMQVKFKTCSVSFLSHKLH